MKKIFLLLYLILCILLSTKVFSQATKKIEIRNSDYIEYDEKVGSDIQKLVGNVMFEHAAYKMYCDSAYFSAKQIINAYGNVHIEQGDTLHLYGDYLKYSGETKLAEVRDNVRLIDEDMYLETEFLDFDLAQDLGYYFNGGKIYNGENTLKSSIGYYFARDKVFFFKDTVEIRNAKYNIYSDTLKYHTETEISYFFGPTEIISDNNYIYCENGWYDLKLNISQFNKNAYYKNDEQLLKGDSLYYERDNGIGKAFNNVELIDTIENIILQGQYGYYQENPEKALLTEDAVFMQITEGDTLYLHADSLLSDLYTTDTLGDYKIIRAFHKVKIYRFDMQGMCDSLSYSFKDSIIRLYDNPVLWSEENQLTSDFIEIHTLEGIVDKIKLYGASFIVIIEDTLRFNQMKGKNMIGYFKDNELYKVDVMGSGQTIFYPKEQETIIGINKAECTDMIIYLKDKKPDKVYFLKQPQATLYPPDGLSREELYLKGFSWLDKQRPKSKQDIFIWIEEQ